jgi:PAS domain S-box-containing protein
VLLDRDLSIVWANKEYLKVTMRDLEEISGKNLFEAFPSEGESYRQLRASLDRVRETGEIDEIAHIRYDIPDQHGSFDTHFWSATHTPILDENGKVDLILQHTVDITEVEQLRRMREAMGVLKRAQAVEERYADANKELTQLRALLEQAPGFVAVLGTREHRFVMANAAYRKLVGGRDLIGKTVGEALPEIIAQGFVDTLDRVFATGEPYFGDREEVMMQTSPDGELEQMFLEFIFQPIFNESGAVQGIFIQGHDATEEVQAEDHQRLLVNELNHRVKNTLAVVQGLAQQSFRSVECDSSLEVFGARLAALASAHNLLTERHWETADLGSVVRLAMVVHELATNAIKYGSLSTEEGRISIEWDAAVTHDGTKVSFLWKERNGPKVEKPVTRGFGSRLIQRGFGVGQGSAQLEYSSDGFECRIEAVL